MKRVFTFLSAFVLTAGIASAQSGARIVQPPHSNGIISAIAVTGHQPYYFSRVERDREIRRVNERYRSEISRLNHARFMRSSVKRQRMQSLKNWRNHEISKIHAKYNSRMNRYNKSRSGSYGRRH